MDTPIRRPTTSSPFDAGPSSSRGTRRQSQHQDRPSPIRRRSRLFRSKRFGSRGSGDDERRRVDSAPHPAFPPPIGSSSFRRSMRISGHSVPVHAPTMPPRSSSLPPTMSEAQTSSSQYSYRCSGHTEFLMQLSSLKDGRLFAGRYRLEEQRIQGKPHCRYAIEKCTGQRVFLKFFPRDSADFDNAVYIYDALDSGNSHISRLVEIIEGIHGFPPCLVLERGDYTLAERTASGQMSLIDQRAILNSVLEALDRLHSRGITHGNVDPAHLMWFTAECSWKLVDLEHATREDRTSAQHEPGRYASPEFIQAKKRIRTPLQLDPSTDMWSFGVIAFEVLTCSSVADSIGIVEYIDRELQMPSVDAERTLKRWLSVNPRGRIECGSDEQNLRFVQSFLRKNPDERRTAADALEDPLFRSATDVFQRMDSHENSALGASERKDAFSMPDWVWTIGIVNRLKLVVDVEYLPSDIGETFPFYMRTGEQAWMFDDDYLPSHSIYFIRLGKTYRLHIRITPESESGLIVQKIVSVTVKPPDSDSVVLNVEQRRRDEEIVALALFQPLLLGSRRLQIKSPHWGNVEEKYVRLEVGMKILFGEPLSRELEFHKAIYCKVIGPGSKLRLHKFLGMIKNEKVLRRPFEME